VQIATYLGRSRSIKLCLAIEHEELQSSRTVRAEGGKITYQSERVKMNFNKLVSSMDADE
jgi:hypothetical protein